MCYSAGFAAFAPSALLQFGLLDPGPSLAPMLYVALGLGVGLFVAYLVHVHHLAAQRKAAGMPQDAAPQASPAGPGAPVPPLAPAPLAAEPASGIPPHIVAVISAAICATESSPHIIRSVAVAAPTLSWAYEGRSQIFHSHRVR